MNLNMDQACAEANLVLDSTGLLEDEHKQDPNYVPPAKTTGAHKDTHEQQKGEHHGGHQTNSHKSKISLTKVKEKLHIGKSRDS